MLDRISIKKGDRYDSIRKRNIQAVLGLLKIKSKENESDYKNFRIQKNEFQKNVLKDVFKLTKFPSKQTRDDLALLLNHTNRGIQIWFQNQRNNREDKDDDKSSDVKCSFEKFERSKRGTIDILTLVDIIENNIPGEKKSFWENFINHVPQYY